MQTTLPSAAVTLHTHSVDDFSLPASGATYPELSRVVEHADLRTEQDGLLETLQELVLEGDDLTDVAKQLLGVLPGEERLLLQGLQVALDKAVQVLGEGGDGGSRGETSPTHTAG